MNIEAATRPGTGLRPVPDDGDLDGSDVDVVVVGSGFGGLGMGLQLARAGSRSFLVLERADEVGGTWRDNRYPGVACDIPAHLYSFSFQPKGDWARVYAPGSEIQEYLRTCSREPGLAENIRLGTEMLGAVWDAPTGRWRIRTNRGTCTATALVMAAGRLSEPRVPGPEVLGPPQSSVFHSARWPEGLDVSGLRVAVVGTGASAVQVVPHLARAAAHTVVFQRSAPWVVPRDDRPYTPAERESFATDDDVRLTLRHELFAQAEQGFAARAGDRAARAALRRRALNHLAQQVPDERLRDTLTPRYEIGCKRILLSNDYYPALASSRVTVEPSALARVESSTAISRRGWSYPFDILVLATGFRASRPPFAARIRGRDGRVLADHWRNGMTAHASTVMHGYPNLFVINGPNASLGHNSAVDMIETQVSYVLGALKHLSRGWVLEVTAAAEEAYTRQIDDAARSTVWLTGGCTSWYRDRDRGRLTLLWPGTAESFRRRNGVFDVTPFLLSRAGASDGR